MAEKKEQIHTEKNKKEIKEHGSYAFPVNVCTESIQKYEHNSFLWHWHPEIELTLILSGEIEYHVNSQKYFLSAGEGLFGNSNTLHSGYQKDGKACSYLSITFHPRFLYGYEDSVLQTKYVGFITGNESWPSLKLTRDVPWQEEVLSLMEQIYALFQAAPDDYELQTHRLIFDIWERLYRYYSALPENKKRPQRHLQRLRDIITYIEAHYNENISLDDIAAHVNVCKSECCRFFKKHMNMTIFEYLLFLRIQNSLPLLKNGESVTAAAGKCGFSSPAYYGQIFKRYMKCSPMEYQRRTLS